ncbi:MAG: M15 family metallopeptidase [Erysipelotrichaceae bacterium]|nr:M15 family metallopeptidase [Erysipelotrichaceae bacterium]
MKIKIWHLFLIITLLFACSFYVVNQRFDKFYRVNGINNDNRVLIEKYLDEDEQTYLIDNQISVDLFIDYLKYDDFYLPYYQYYNALASSSHYDSVNDILDVGNQLADRLIYLYNNKAFSYADILISDYLELAFLNQENFNFDYVDYYVLLKPLYDKDDYSFVIDCETYLDYLQNDGINEEQWMTIMTNLTSSYNKDTLYDLFTIELEEGTHIVYTPDELTTLVDNTHYIGQYEANDLILCQDISRVRYTMYLRKDAYNALKEMYDEISAFNENFLLREAYISYDSLDDGGYDEFQLGLSINIGEIGISYADFEDTDLSSWLENNSYKYGFVLRYPKQKASVTGNSYDAHIYRYVGVEAATYMYENNLTLEEYLGSLSL